MSTVTGLEVVSDRTASSRCDEGFLRVRRLVLRSRYADGSASEDYAYDVVSRRQPDAVAVVVYDVRPDGTVLVALKSGVRPPVWLRGEKDLVQPDDGRVLDLPEVVAGLLEDDDRGPRGIDRRAAVEVLEETGFDVDPGAMEPLGAPLFPSPGVSDEKVHFRAVRTDLSRAGRPSGDGSVLERDSTVAVHPLAAAIRACRAGRIPDMKTEVALVRLAERFGP